MSGYPSAMSVVVVGGVVFAEVVVGSAVFVVIVALVLLLVAFWQSSAQPRRELRNPGPEMLLRLALVPACACH